MKKLAVFGLALAVSGCVSSPDFPQRTFQVGTGLGSIGIVALSEAEKNAAARNFIEAIANKTNQSLVTSISLDNPRNQEFSSIILEFSRRAAVPFSSNTANLVVKFDISETGGALTGPQIRNDQMFITIIRPNSLLGGDQIIAMRSVRYRCNTESRISAPTNCLNMIPKIAEGLLYDLAANYGS